MERGAKQEQHKCQSKIKKGGGGGLFLEDLLHGDAVVGDDAEEVEASGEVGEVDCEFGILDTGVGYYELMVCDGAAVEVEDADLTQGFGAEGDDARGGVGEDRESGVEG